VVQIPVLCGAGAWSDRYGHRDIYMLGVMLGGIWAFRLIEIVVRHCAVVRCALI
jgi:hypothetical protein